MNENGQSAQLTRRRRAKAVSKQPNKAKAGLHTAPNYHVNARATTIALAKTQLRCVTVYLLAITMLHFVAPNMAAPFYKVQYAIDAHRAGKGRMDTGLVLSGIMGVVGLRALTQLVTLTRISPRFVFASPKGEVRFAEQLWGFLWYAGNCSLGLWLLYRPGSQYSFDPESIWRGYPQWYMEPATKRYYLTTLGFWAAQLYIINVEERRSDHYQMSTHHVVTCALVWGSFMWSYTRLGHLVMILMDGVDVLLCAAKVLRYIQAKQFCIDSCFLAFLVAWVYFRHYIYVYQIGYGFFVAPKTIGKNCAYAPGSDIPLQCFSRNLHIAFALLATILQVITLIWLVMIVNVVIKVIRGEGADDTRSDDED